MTDLNQQLEDKKKGCGAKCEHDNEIWTCGETFMGKVYIMCPTCKAEIAILEQAIAEIKKQRQEILEDVEDIVNEFINDSDIDGRGICFEFHDTDLFELRDKLSKLNQPKTEE